MPAEEIVTVRSRMPGSEASGMCSPVEDQVLVDLVGDGEEVVLDAQAGDLRPARPVRTPCRSGCAGEFSRISRVAG